MRIAGRGRCNRWLSGPAHAVMKDSDMGLKQGLRHVADRRTLLQGAWTACGLALLPGMALARRDHGFFTGHDLKIGLELYTLGDVVAKDLDGTFARVAEIGYREIELPNLF